MANRSPSSTGGRNRRAKGPTPRGPSPKSSAHATGSKARPVDAPAKEAAAKPGAAKPGAAKPGAGKPGAGKPGAVGKPGAAKPGAAKPRTAKPGRFTPKAGKASAVPAPTGRYTPPIPRSKRSSPPWVPALLLTLLILGGLVIVCDYLGVLPYSPTGWYLLVGLGLLAGGFGVATQYR